VAVIPLIMAAALLISVDAAAQQQGASRVALATVTDPRNRAIVDVEADDFVIQEGNAAREILSVHVADYPVVLMIDTGAAARADWPNIHKAALRFVDRVGRERPLALGTFGGTPQMIATFEDDRDVLVERLTALEPTIAEGHAVLGAAFAAGKLTAAGSLFSAIVLVSASGDVNEGAVGDETLSPIVGSNTILHVVVNTASRAGTAPRTGASMLRAIVEQTHGHYTSIYTGASYQPALDQIADRLIAELMIEYLVLSGSRPIDVKMGVRIPGARVRGLSVAPR
jgi:hypothetical protein